MEILTDKYKIKIRTLKELGYTPRYAVERKDESDKHIYTIDGWETWYPGVSSVLNVLNKYYLVPWASKENSLKTSRLIKKIRDKYKSVLFQEKYCRRPIVSGDAMDIFDRLLSDKNIGTITNYGKNAHQRIKETAADIGSRAHQAIDDITNGKTPIIAEDIRYPVEGFLDWLKKTHLTIVSGDIKVASIAEQYGGSIDALFIDEKERLILGDYKTSKQFSDEYVFQVALYGNAALETFALKQLPPAFIIRFDKIKPVVEIRGISHIYEAWIAARSLVWTHKLMQINYWDDIQKWTFKPSKLKE